MKSNSLTLVTALFNINREFMGNSFARSFDHYKECFSKLLKVKHIPMTIFCEKELENFIWEYRDKENTKLIFKTLDDLRNFPFYRQVQNIRNDQTWLNQAGWLKESTQAKLELYNPLVMSKQFLLNDATLFNFFDSNYFLWIDAGLANTVQLNQYLTEDFEKRIIKKLNKMLYVCFPYDGTVEVHGFNKVKLNEYAGLNTTHVARGGVFGGPKHLINEINDIYYNLLHNTLNSGLMGTEESIFTIISYKHKDKCNLEYIENNGLVYKFFENLNKLPVSKNSSERLAIYVLTYNIPKQFTLWMDAFKKAFPREFNSYKKYVINNSDDVTVKNEYDELFKTNGFEVIHENSNIGINTGRHFAAEHFDKSDHEYMIFFEDDFLLCDESTYKDKLCKSGFARWIPDLFNKAIGILEYENLDFLKLQFQEFYGDNHKNWAYENVPQHRREEYFPNRTDDVPRDRTKISHTGTHRNVAYAVGEYFYCNWPLLFNKDGNRKVFLDVVFAHKYEQTIMSQNMTHQREGKVKSGILLATPVEHNRKYHYAANKRKENEHG